MAYANITRSNGLGQSGFADRVSRLVKTLADMRETRRVYRITVRELNGLSERELADLGIHRSMIPVIAREAAYGK